MEFIEAWCLRLTHGIMARPPRPGLGTGRAGHDSIIPVFRYSNRTTWRPFGPEPFGPEPFGPELKAEGLKAEGLKAERLSTGCERSELTYLRHRGVKESEHE
ncbi:MAG: hypothetical protein ISS66_10330 [Desulfobacteraceae bacterium]|nr:hypothetical protein [Desulfobacteraceae bacterium]